MIDLHTHSLLSDGELLPSELIRRAEVIGYEGIGITDHADRSNLDWIIPRIVSVCAELNRCWKIRAVPGIELTHVPPETILLLCQEARALGAKLVVVHGETIAEPVCPGTNRKAIERVMNFFPPERHRQIYLQLSLNMKAIISQRLIPTIDGWRVAAVEVLLDTPRVKDLIYKGHADQLKEVMAEGSMDGMQTFDQSIFDLYKRGLIDQDNALSYADSTNDLRLRIKMEEMGNKKESMDVHFRLKPDLRR